MGRLRVVFRGTAAQELNKYVERGWQDVRVFWGIALISMCINEECCSVVKRGFWMTLVLKNKSIPTEAHKTNTLNK